MNHFYLFIYLLIYLFIYLLTYLFIYLSIFNLLNVDTETTFFTFGNKTSFPGRVTTISNL